MMELLLAKEHRMMQRGCLQLVVAVVVAVAFQTCLSEQLIELELQRRQTDCLLVSVVEMAISGYFTAF